MGAGLRRSFPFVDYVVRGEGERTFPELLSCIVNGRGFEDVPGLCWSDGSNDVVRVNKISGRLAAAEIPVPIFDDWFEIVSTSGIAEDIEPQLVVETSRGCWWGQAHHCTFCGLNGTSMEFRPKDPNSALEEIAYLIRRHETLDVIVVDNIIDQGYFRSLLPALAELGWDTRIHYEVKSNLDRAAVTALMNAGITHVQPGIESLSSSVLKLMRKGVTGTRNVRSLRDLESAGLTVSWNILYGFPGETAADYSEVIPQLPNLVHLQPPASAGRIILERFSPYYDNPSLGFGNRSPASFYRHVYDLPEAEVSSLAYMFETDRVGLDGDLANQLLLATLSWIDSYPRSSLDYVDCNDRIVIEDRRAGHEPCEYEIADPVWVAAFRELEHGRSVQGLLRRLTERGFAVDEPRIAEWVDELLSRGIVFVESGQIVTLPTCGVPRKVSGE